MLNCPREAISNPQGIRDAIEHAPVELRQQSHSGQCWAMQTTGLDASKTASIIFTSDMSPLGIQPKAYLDGTSFPWGQVNLCFADALSVIPSK